MNDHLLFLDLGFIRVYWFGFFVGCAILAAAFLYCLLRKIQCEKFADDLGTVLCVLPAAFASSRLSYCWFRHASFSNGFRQYLHISSGGYSLFGALAGVIAVLLVCSRIKGKSFMRMTDAAVPALSVAIAVGRFAGVTAGEDTGFEVTSDRSMPFLIWSEAEQANVLWVGFFEGIFALLAAGLTFILFINHYRSRIPILHDGCVTLCFMLTFGLSQSILESMRGDSLFMVTLGFVRIDQIISILMAVSSLAIICVDNLRVCGFSVWRPVLWIICAAALTVAVVCEFSLSATYLAQLYACMGASLLVMWTTGNMLFLDTARARAISFSTSA